MFIALQSNSYYYKVVSLFQGALLYYGPLGKSIEKAGDLESPDFQLFLLIICHSCSCIKCHFPQLRKDLIFKYQCSFSLAVPYALKSLLEHLCHAFFSSSKSLLKNALFL